jgi:hypothetical protein
MENVYNFKNRVLSGITALAIAAGGYMVATPTNAYAAGHKYGTYYSEEMNYEYNTYKVEEDDLTASNLSSKVLRYFINKKEVPAEDLEIFRENPDASCRFWPAIVYTYIQTKGKAYHTTPGETIYFPKTYEELKSLNAELKRNGWYSSYCQKHNIYPKKKTVYIDRETARQKVSEILNVCYPESEYCVDDDMLDVYLRTIGGRNIKYVYKKDAKLNKYQDWEFYEWIPSEEDLEQTRTKTKRK